MPAINISIPIITKLTQPNVSLASLQNFLLLNANYISVNKFSVFLAHR